jgi:3-methyladenine DNA glycosylase/8-oxoguanine DNA glycosylase
VTQTVAVPPDVEEPAPRAGVPGVSREWRPPVPVDVLATLRPLRRGTGDPTFVVTADGAVWRTAPTPQGPATYVLERAGAQVRMTAWGPGAAWVLETLPRLLGGAHDCDGLALDRPLLREAAARSAGLRTPATGLVFEALAAAVLEQKVTGVEARRSWRELLFRFGTTAPGPVPRPMRVAPPAAVWRRIPSWEWHRAGVDAKRSTALVTAARVAARLEECVAMSPAEAQRRLGAVPGIGVWTAAEVAQRALGDCDAVSFGDYHVPAAVGWALLGRPVDDDGLAELLEPYRPHRYRVVRLVELSGRRKPRFGPRAAVRDTRGL